MLPRLLQMKGAAGPGQFSKRRLSPDVHHGPRCGNEIWLADVVAFFFLCNDALNKFFQLFVAGAALHLRVQVVIPDGEKTGADFSIAGDADAAAMAAEGM